MNNTPILNAQKELRDLYGVCQVTGKMDDQSFVSLRQAIQIEYQKKHSSTQIDSLETLSKNWFIDNKLRTDLISEIQSGLSFPYDDPMAYLVRIALALHGYDQDLTKSDFTIPLIDSLTGFSNDLGVGASGWGMSWYDTAWMTLLTPVNTRLVRNNVKHQSIRVAQRMLNYVVNDLIQNDSNDAKLINNVDDPHWMSHDLILTKTDGIYDQETKSFMQLVLNYCRLYDGFSSLSLHDYLKNKFSDEFGDKKNLATAGLIFAGFLNQGNTSIDDIPYEDRDEAIDAFKAFYQVDGGDFFVALFLGDHKQLTAKKINFIGSMTKTNDSVSGLQSFYFDQDESRLCFDQLHRNKQNGLTCDNDLYSIDFGLGGSNRELTFSSDNMFLNSEKYLQHKDNLKFGHTQTLFVIDNKLFTGCNYQDKRKFKYGDNCWCKDIIVIDQKDLTKYKIITGIFDVVKSLGGDDTPYRTEMTISPDHKRVLFTPIDQNKKQWFLLYNYSDVTDALNKIDYGKALDLSKIDRVDEFGIVNFTGSDTAILKSVQGYAIDNDGTIFISSERVPKFENGKLKDKSPSIIFRMRWNHGATQRKYYLNLLPLDTDFIQQLGTTGGDTLVLGELEDLQYLNDHSILLAVTWHVLKYDPSIVNQPDFQITSDYINLNQIEDRVDLYQIDLD